MSARHSRSRAACLAALLVALAFCSAQASRQVLQAKPAVPAAGGAVTLPALLSNVTAVKLPPVLSNTTAATTPVQCQPGTGGKSCKACAPGTFSLGGDAECKACPPQAMCLRMPSECDMLPPCDPATGKPTSMCFVKKPDGAVCKPGVPGDTKQIVPADAPATHTCKAGQCVPLSGGATTSLAKPADAPATKPADAPATKPAGAPATKPAGATATKPADTKTSPAKCPGMPMCRSMAGPCDMAPPCDAAGKPTSMCWVKKADGAVCKPGVPGTTSQIVPADAPATHTCQAGQCVPLVAGAATSLAKLASGATTLPAMLAGAATPSNTTKAADTKTSPPKCPDTPMCRSMAGPCDTAPSCDAAGKPLSMCWVKKADGAVCMPGMPGTSTQIVPADGKATHQCKAGECVPIGH